VSYVMSLPRSRSSSTQLWSLHGTKKVDKYAYRTEQSHSRGAGGSLGSQLCKVTPAEQEVS